MNIDFTNNNEKSNHKHSVVSYKLMMYERLFVLMASLIPLAIFNVKLGVGLSVDRVLLGLLVLFFPFYFIKRKTSGGMALVLVCFGVMSLVLSLRGWVDTKGILKFFPSLLQAYFIFGIGAFVFKDNPRAMRIINMIFVLWAIIFLLFSAYMLFFYYVVGTTHVPFPTGAKYSDLDHVFHMMHDRRLFLPLASAPHLGAVAGFIALWGIIVFIKTRRWLMLFLGILMLSITILTLSRGPVLAFVVAFSFLLGLGVPLKAVKINKQLLGVVLACFFIFIGIKYYQGLQLEKIGKVTINRLSIDVDELSQSRHLDLRIHALKMYLQGDLSQLLCGQGFGAFMESGVGDYSFSSYLTLLVETGLFGALIFTMIIVLPLIICGWKLFLYKSRFLFLSVFSMALFVALVHFFYELKTLQCLWLQTAFVFGMSQSRLQNIITAEDWFSSSGCSICS